jgi:hypothetical protein
MTTDAAVSPAIVVSPSNALVDEPLSIRLTGLPPGQPVTLRARMHDHLDRPWASAAVFRAGPTGAVDVTTAAPETGSYSGVDAMGLFWSMQPEPGSLEGPFALTTLAPLTATLTADVDGAPVATASVERRFVADGVTVTEVREQGLVAPAVAWRGRCRRPRCWPVAASLPSRWRTSACRRCPPNSSTCRWSTSTRPWTGWPLGRAWTANAWR